MLKQLPSRCKTPKSKVINSVEERYNSYNVPLSCSEFLSSCRIRSGVGFVRFVVYPYQKALLDIIDSHSGTIIIKDRQLGITELLAGRALHQMFLNPAYAGALISISQQKTSEVRDRIKSMPTTTNFEWEKNSGAAIKIVDGGSFSLLPSTDNAARGLPSVAELYFDEAGFPANFAELYGAGTAAQEMVPIEFRKTIICTTIPPDGSANAVWRMFAQDNDRSALDALKEARGGGGSVPGLVWWTDRNGWAKVIISHTAHPIYSQAKNYIDDVCERRKIPRAIAEREHNLGIEQASSSLFHDMAIDASQTSTWQGHKLGRKYFAMIDPNFGGSDNFVMLVFDITETRNQLVAEYAESDRSIEYSVGHCLKVLEFYRIKLLAIESNSGGKIVHERLIEHRPDIETLLTLTTHASKKNNTDRIALALEQGEIGYPEGWAGMGEMSAFSATEREATVGEKDDRVMAMAAGWAHMATAKERLISIIQPGRVRY